ncbi:MAG: nucleotidyltransferase family protein [Pseudomonadales bacterium]|nr:nucleotidyltransferase family protein [Pseudomonadales bacterium]
MKAMILAAGLGNRMRPLTLTTPKPLLMVGGKPLIVWHIEALKVAGIQDIVINTAWLGHKLHEALGDGSAFGVNIFWSDENEPLETAGGIQQALPLLGKEPFLLVNGDIWLRYDFSRLVSKDLGKHLAHLLLVDNPPQHPNGDFAFKRDGQSLILPQGAEKYTFAGVSVLSPKLFADLPAGKAPLAPLLRQAIAEQLVTGEYHTGAWVDVGTPERLQALDDELSRKQA